MSSACATAADFHDCRLVAKGLVRVHANLDRAQTCPLVFVAVARPALRRASPSLANTGFNWRIYTRGGIERDASQRRVDHRDAISALVELRNERVSRFFLPSPSPSRPCLPPRCALRFNSLSVRCVCKLRIHPLNITFRRSCVREGRWRRAEMAPNEGRMTGSSFVNLCFSPRLPR